MEHRDHRASTLRQRPWIEIVLLLVIQPCETIERKPFGVLEQSLDVPTRAITVRHYVLSLVTIDEDTFSTPPIAPTELLEDCINNLVRCL
jgi:hypothetical protein